MTATRAREMKRSSAQQWMKGVVVLVTVYACDGVQGDHSTAEFAPLDSSRVAALSLLGVADIPLAGVGPDAAVQITKLLVTSGALYTIDEGAGAVRKYDRSGRLVFSVPTGRKSLDRMISPEALAARGDSLFVMDMNQANGIAIISGDGRVVGHIDVPTTASLSTIATMTSGLAITSIGLESEVVEGKALFLSTVGVDGGFRPVGCTADPKYAESLRNRGFIGLFRGVGVSVYEDRLYCRQPISPEVQVFAANGDTLPNIKVVPPFYKAGKDAPQSMNQLDVNQFTSTWTEHLDFHAFDAGFLSIYAHFDVKRNARTYSLFRCLNSGNTNHRCAVAEMWSQPMAFLAPDTLVTIEVRPTPNGSAVVARLFTIQ